jgi:two-component system sensor histidine kinase EvgS
LSSVPGQGTRVAVSLPVEVLEGLAPSGQVPASPAPAATAQGPLVLLVEDHPVNQQAIALQLEALGYRSLLAEDGPAALRQLVPGHPFAAVLLDCQLPGMDGYEVARRIRACEALHGLARVPVLAISAANDDRHRERVFDSGMDASLSKPLALPAMQALLDLWAPHSREASPSAQQQALSALFVRSTEEDLLEIEAGLREGDEGRIVQRAHRIRGAALMVGATEVAELAGELEEHPVSAPQTHHYLASLRAALARYGGE